MPNAQSLSESEAESKSTVFYFFCNGITSLLGWNAVLSSLDYFANAYPNYNVYSNFPLPLFAGYLLVAVSYHILSLKFKYIKMIYFGNIAVNVELVLLFLCSVFFKD